MSFILDALRRAERDRSLGHAPRMEDVALAHEATPRGEAERLRPSLVLMIVALSLLVISLLSFALFRKHPAAPVAAAPVSSGVVTATIRGPAPGAAPHVEHEAPAARADTAAASTAPPAIAADEPIASLDDLADTAPPTPSPNAAPESEEAVAAREFIARPAPASAATAPPEAAPSTRALDLGSAPARATPAAPSSASSATPLRDMPDAYRTAFPVFAIDVHAWDSDPAKRFTMVDGRRYHEGDTMLEGPRVVEIEQEGIVMEYNGATVFYTMSD